MAVISPVNVSCLKKIGTVEVPQKAFLAVLKLD